MGEIHYVGGGKGGVGKSTVCCALLEALMNVPDDEDMKSLTVFETDRSNPDVQRRYGRVMEVRLAIYSEADRFEDAANSVYNAALDNRVVVNLPAQEFPAMKQWWEVNHIARISRNDGVKMHMWFVTDGGYDSIQLFKKSLKFYGLAMKHILVKNYGRNDEFQALEDDEQLRLLIEESGTLQMDFPKLHGSRIRNKIDRESLTYGEVAAGGIADSINTVRVARFLEKACEAFRDTGVLE